MTTKSPADAEATMVANLEASTGKSLDDWLKLLKEHFKEKHGAIVTLLKSKHGVTHGYANLIAHKLLRSDAGSAAGEGVDLIVEQYAGAKASLRPIYDALSRAANDFGPDVEFAPKKAYVSLRRSKQFALVQPSTATRVDIGLNLKGLAPSGRLEMSGTWNSMVTHRVKVGNVKEVDSELISWLKRAYENA